MLIKYNATMLARIFRPKSAKSPVAQQRFNDAVVIIRQDNQKKSLPVEASNDLVSNLLGYEAKDIVNHDLREFVSPEVKEVITENLEFEIDAASVDEILKKISNFRMRTKQGAEIPIRIRVMRSLSANGIDRFQLVMNDRSLMESLDAHRQNSRAELTPEQVVDPETNILTEEALLNDMEFISRHAEMNQSSETTFVVFKFFNHEKNKDLLGEEQADAIIGQLVDVIKKSKRETDFAGYYDDDSIILVLTETPLDHSKTPVERIISLLPPETRSEIKTTSAIIRASDDINDLIAEAISSS